MWANRLGPKPVRSREFPFGFPWLKGELKEKADLGTWLVMRCVETLEVAPPNAICLWEHPEDLGRARNGTPASVWQLDALRKVARQRGMDTIAFHQCTYGADYPKPTRFLSDAAGLLQLGFGGWPILSKDLYYLGPLPRSCGHSHQALIGASDKGGFKTGPTAAYPPQMNEMIATLLFKSWHKNQHPTPCGRGVGRCAEAGMEEVRAEREERPAEDPAMELADRGGQYPMRGPGQKLFHDGAGLCSQGNRRPAFRDISVMSELGEEFLSLTTEKELRRDLYRLALGRCEGPPFREGVVEAARGAWLRCLAQRSGVSVESLNVVEPRQPFWLAAIGEHLKIIGDPDRDAFGTGPDTFRSGVQLGVQGMPRVPEVFEAKEKWRKYEPIPWPTDKGNYTSAVENAIAVQKQFRKEEALGAMVEMEEEEVRRKYGSELRVAALAALEKTDHTFRVVHDATHNVGVNAQIKVEDQLRYPGPSEIKLAMQALFPLTFILAEDIARAHRLVLVREEDWGYQACRTGVGDSGEPSSKIWLNTVGTFGVTSASYHFTRLFAAVSRCAHSLLARRDSCQLTYVDDLLFMANGLGGLAAVWIALLFLMVVGTPFSWRKFQGGARAEWIGFQVDVAACELGMTEKRLRWARDWLERTVANKVVRVEEFRSALGRLAFMMSAFTHLKPLLGPLYSWVTAVDHCNTLQVPAAVLMILAFLKTTMVPEIARTKVRLLPEVEEEHVFRSDAKAEGETVVLGGWCCSDSPDRAKCRWFSVRLGRSNAPWVFESGEPYRAIASLELLGTLASTVAFPPKPGSAKKFFLSAGTDNLGNRHLVSRLLTTKFPLCIVLMQLAWTLHCKDLELRLDWLPRLQNREADALTNGDFSGFDMDLRIEIKPEELLEEQFKDLMEKGSELFDEVKELRRKRKEGLMKSMPSSKKSKGANLIGPW